MSLLATLLAFCLCGGGGGATATGKAVRLDPPPPPPPSLPVLFTSESYTGRCVGAEFLLGHFSPGWDPVRMSRIMYRESRCQPAADNSNSTATGLLQILASHCPWLARQMGEPCSAARLTDPAYNVRAGATLWREQGYQAWVTS
jgi:Transglycosylase SLT domain